MSYTKGEWEYIRRENASCIDIRNSNNDICVLYDIVYTSKQKTEKYAKHIIQCVNSHDELLEACKMALQWHRGDKWRMGNIEERKTWERQNTLLQQAINKAEGK